MDQFKRILNEILDTIENEDMMKFALECIKTIPDYIYVCPASSTGKYHPSYSLNTGGLMRHTAALVRIMNHIFDIECMNNWTSRERDMLRIAGMMHDSRKSGSQDDYEKSKYTKFEHPLLAAEVIRGFLGCGIIDDNEIDLIAETIEAHMGQWNTSNHSSVVLPKPRSRMQKMLHMCDYLASRKDIEIKFENTIPFMNDGFVPAPTDPFTTPDYKPEDCLPADVYKLSFGKYKGMTLDEVYKEDKGYIDWLREKSDAAKKEPLKSLLQNYN